MSDIKSMAVPFGAGVIITLVVVYFMGGLNLSSNFKLGTK
jgi:hypothetical protein